MGDRPYTQNPVNSSASRLLTAGAEQAHHMRSEGFMHGNNQSWPCYVLEVHMTSDLACWLGSPRKALLESKLYLLTFVSNRAYILNCQIFISQPGYPKCPQPPTCQTPAQSARRSWTFGTKTRRCFFYLILPTFWLPMSACAPGNDHLPLTEGSPSSVCRG